MTRILRFLAFALVVSVAAPAAAQTLQTTTLGAAVSSSTATTITVADATVQNGQWVWTDREAMLVTAGGGTTSLTVTRGIGGFASSHLIGAYVYFGPPTFFSRNDPASPSCQVGAPNVWINTDSGGMWSCYANVWRSLTSVGPAPVGTFLIGNGSILPPSFSTTAAGTFTFGRVRTGDGTVALPAWSFENDTDSGVYRIGANNIGVGVNGAKVLDISTTGLGVTGTSTLGVVNASGQVSVAPAGNGIIQINTDNNRFRFSGSGSHNYIDSGHDDANGDIIIRTRTAGTPVVNATFYGSGNTTLGGLLTVSGFGAHTFSASGTGANRIQLTNPTAGTGNNVLFRGDTDITEVLYMRGTSSTYTASGSTPQAGASIGSEGAGGLSLAAGHASGAIRFYSGGTTLRAQINTNGTQTWAPYGAGAATFDASGNITSVSDERMKDRIAPLSYGLAEVLALKPIQHGYNEASGLEREHLYGGFSAQNVQTVMPLAVGQGANGMLTLQDRPVLAAVVNAIRELSAEVDALRGQAHVIASAAADPNSAAKANRRATLVNERAEDVSAGSRKVEEDAKRQKREAIRQCRADNEIIVAAKGTPMDCTPDAETKAAVKAEADEQKQREKDQKDAERSDCQRKKKLVEDHGGVWAIVCKAA